MRRIRGSFHFALTVVGTTLIAYAVIGLDNLYERLLLAALGIVLLEAGIWRITQSLFPNERAFRPLRKETDFFVTLVRRLNKNALAAQRGSASAVRDLQQVHDEMHHSVDRMMRLAGLTEEDLGFTYSPRKAKADAAETQLAAARTSLGQPVSTI
ncbi:MAG TPA: hypothetical protein VMN60_07685 [Longimicrobiales bacterium]|nr:hypothetical protein [Longimicrobiales bacterium]